MGVHSALSHVIASNLQGKVNHEDWKKVGFMWLGLGYAKEVSLVLRMELGLEVRSWLG